MSNVNVLIIEDEAIIAEDIREMLNELGYDVLPIVHDSAKAIDFLSFHTPDLVLCDINIKGDKDGIEVASLIGKKKRIPFVFLTSLSDRHTVARAREVLPYGYIVKPFDKRDLLTNIEMALFKFGKEIEDKEINQKKVEQISNDKLTPQEYRILKEMVAGLNNSQIADTLDITMNTLKYHLKNLFGKMEVSNRAGLLQKLLALVTQ